MPQPSGRIQARCQSEANIFGAQLALLVDFGQLHQFEQAKWWIAPQRLEAIANDNAILVQKWNHVCHGSDRSETNRLEQEISQRLDHFLRTAMMLAQRPGQLERNTRSAQSCERIITARQGRVDDSIGGRQLVTETMVIRDDQRQPQFLGPTRRFDTGDAAIDRDQQFLATLSEAFD